MFSRVIVARRAFHLAKISSTACSPRLTVTSGHRFSSSSKKSAESKRKEKTIESEKVTANANESIKEVETGEPVESAEKTNFMAEGEEPAATSSASNAAPVDVLIEETEKVSGPAKKQEFKAETRRLLEIVAKSLYSEKEVFVRELISNASDALEKLRHYQLSRKDGLTAEEISNPMEIRISVDDKKNTFILQDSGIGMTEQELEDHLGTIAKSGSLQFLKDADADATASGSKDKIIGQFGVGFYSALMVGDSIKVYTKSAKDPNSKGYLWSSDGSGSYEISEAEGVSVGTKIIIQLKSGDSKFSSKSTVKSVIDKYSHFVEYPVYLNGTKVNTFEPLWAKESQNLNETDVNQFYKFFFKDYADPSFYLSYKTDSPINIRSLLFAPRISPFDQLQQTESEIALYSRKVLISHKCKDILPKWMRFLKGVVDSEDIPLNLSRELLQNNGALIGKLRDILSKRAIRWLKDQMNSQAEKYQEFYASCGYFIKEGICTDQTRKQQISDLLLFESSVMEGKKMTSLADYVTRMKEDQKDIYYLIAPNRQSALESPYLEPFLAKGYEVLFMYEEYDRMVAQSIEAYGGKSVKSAEQVGSELEVEKKGDSLTEEQGKEMCDWVKSVLDTSVSEVKVTKRFTSFPAIIVDHEQSGLYRMYARKMLGDMAHEMPHKLEINAHHVLIRNLFALKDKSPVTAKIIVSQIFDNALLAAGELSNPRRMLKRVNSFMESLVTGKDLAEISSEEPVKVGKGEPETMVPPEMVAESPEDAAKKESNN